MCDQSAYQSDHQPVAAQAAYVVDPSHKLYDDSAAKEYLSKLPTAIADALRATAHTLTDAVLVRTLMVLTSPATIVMELLQPEREVIHSAIMAACVEEITRRYRAGTLAVQLVRGGEEAAAYLNSPAAEAEIEAFRVSVERRNATLN